MSENPLHHIVRVRTADDLNFIGQGLMDEIVINANHLENSAQSCAAKLWKTSLPFSIDPVLWRFQLPNWSQNGKGDTKRNYKRLGKWYGAGTNVAIGSVPLAEAAITDQQWRMLAGNVIAYQQDRLRDVPTQLELLAELRELRPSRLTAPALVAFSEEEDRVNQLMADAAAEGANQSVAVQVIIPLERLLDVGQVGKLINSVPTDGVTSYLLWTPQVTEEQLITDAELLGSLIRLVAELANRGIAVGHQYANYTVLALHSLGLAASTHHLGWVDRGEPAEERAGVPRSCRTYVPGLRHSVRFAEARRIGESLTPDDYLGRFCDCTYCVGMFSEGGHPFDWLLEAREISLGERSRLTPSSRSVGANTWHFLLSRRQEVEAFSVAPAIEVIRRDIERAASLNSDSDVTRLERLAQQLRSA